ncbi:Ubiquitin-conjugating enzyme E2 32 [Cymbomonas tetramitiformis]|uniref:Ubiquitin-conjugating enzyme E2 32 n=1 Tax=Cymbomonas tetramitiformis TaxID=36881 RepID=A0AAE0FBM4_9CHLO|nr:Ubiquitin-conjugating enzyme E2 32 [Cymbomonas tetramitiformis]
MSLDQHNPRNPAVKRILQELKEFRTQSCRDVVSEPLQDNIFEWQFAIRGAAGTDFEGGIYHGRILLPPEYPFKPPSFLMQTPNGRFAVGTKLCLSISQHHPEQWQPSWSVRTALVALIAFMPTKAEGAIGGLNYTADERRALAIKSQDNPPNTSNPIRNELIAELHRRLQDMGDSVAESSSEAPAPLSEASDPCSPSNESSEVKPQIEQDLVEGRETLVEDSEVSAGTTDRSPEVQVEAQNVEALAADVPENSPNEQESALPDVVPTTTPGDSACSTSEQLVPDPNSTEASAIADCTHSCEHAHLSSPCCDNKQQGAPSGEATDAVSGVTPAQSSRSAGQPSSERQRRVQQEDRVLNFVVKFLVGAILALLCRKALIFFA